MQKRKRNFFIRAIRRVYALTDEYVILPFWGIVPRMIFGNNAGLLNNVGAALEHQWIKYRVGPLNKNLFHPQASILKKNGLLELGTPYDDQLIHTIKKKTLLAFNDTELTVKAGEPPYNAAHIILKHPLSVVPEIIQLLDDNMHQLLTSYYQSHFKVTQVRVWRNCAVPGIDTDRPIYSNQWHNDQFNTNEIKLFVYLTDNVNGETGAFRAFKLGDTKKIMRNFGYFRRSHIYGSAKKMTNDTTKMVCVEGNAGNTFLANATRCLHRAGVPKLGSKRDIVQFCFKPSTEKLSSNWHQNLPIDTYDD